MRRVLTGLRCQTTSPSDMLTTASRPLLFPAVVDRPRRRLGHKVSRLTHRADYMLRVCERVCANKACATTRWYPGPPSAHLRAARRSSRISHQRSRASSLISRGRPCNRLLHPFHDLPLLVRLAIKLMYTVRGDGRSNRSSSSHISGFMCSLDLDLHPVVRPQPPLRTTIPRHRPLCFQLNTRWI